ncbi:putative flavoprotein involved in K+ transport [Hymenobacter luteus]|uniref:Flavoprotein involved in K+ transport n=2 Tax=Hymenobacter TaxID=89966 RepID=A0ABR6JSD3_9BACT|nr:MULTISPECIES: NAD(P)/FAD-dependent oxidoreductase [Hymenobacter]MBB4599739.1 putative flavoprotein involved in K+ transport [Hymenobacter latericoloratus]MBB6057951.1 putative flavoprotein involved in K+ transport [Hymenobacter luteus]
MNSAVDSCSSEVHTVVVGAGQAGLAAAYYLRRAGVPFVVLDERAAVGEVWAGRYDSLRLFSPAWASNLPGLPWPGRGRRYPTKQEAAAYLRQYAEHFRLPIETGQRVTSVQPAPGGFLVRTAAGRRISTRQLIVCTGPYTAPKVPAFSQSLPPATQQLHSSQYLRPAQISDSGPVAVVGSGNSALQIAADLAAAGQREVFVAFDEKTPAMPNNTAMWVLLLGTGLLQVGRNSVVGRLLRSRPEPVVRQDLRRLRQFPNVHFIGRALHATAAATLQGQRYATPPLSAVIWATGFGPDYSWLQVPGALDPTGQPRHARGLSPVPGLAFLGLPWLHSRRSALMGGAGSDAAYVVASLLKKT